MLLLLLACADAPKDTGAETAAPPDDTGEPPAPPPAWDAAAEAVPCDPAADAPLLDAALADAGLTRDTFGVSDDDWNSFRTYVKDPYNLSWYKDVHHHPEQASCFARQVQADLDAAAAAAHPVAALIGAYAPYIDVTPTLDPIDPGATTLEDALTQLADAAGGGDDPARAAELDPALATALTPIVLALADVLTVRAQLDADATFSGANSLYKGAPGLVLAGRSYAPDITDSAYLDAFEPWYLDEARAGLTEAARRLAFAVEDADLDRFAGADVAWSWSTEAGGILLSGPADDTHGDDEGELLFALETGGNDTYTGGAGATANQSNAASVLVDLGGDDTYGYVEVADPHDTSGTLPSDADGRTSVSGYYPSVSDVGRQGSGRYGVGMLFDRGGGADRYRSLRHSQGYGALGVGVLADDGGDDVYEGEAGVQGAGIWGLGILYDAGGNDAYTAWAFAQGFAYVGSGGLLYDADGIDTYWSDPGNDYGGTTLYYSPQLASGQGNSSFTQGAGFGLRGDAYGIWYSGGFGTLRDAGGDDDYTAGVFAQATGYWQGTGLLADASGDDEYDALWYVQGGAAHFALAILVDGAGNDRYDPEFTAYNVSLGSGHDFSVGVAIDEEGDDTYRSTTLAMGASNCQGIGVFVDGDGSDTYEALSTYGYGLGNHSTECNEATGRTQFPSIGVFLDAGGDADTYVWPDPKARTPADDSTFGIAWAGTADEYGGAVDGDGETNLHAR